MVIPEVQVSSSAMVLSPRPPLHGSLAPRLSAEVPTHPICRRGSSTTEGKIWPFVM